MDVLFIDFETTGRNPFSHQAYEFASVPVQSGIIRLDLVWHTYIKHRTYKIEEDILQHVAKRLAEPKAGVPTIDPHEWGPTFRNMVKNTIPTPGTLGGKNVGGFDWQFMLALDNTLRFDHELLRYSHVDIGSLFLDETDYKVPSLAKCRERAIEDGAPLTVDNTHFALDDAMLCAELFCWEMYGKIRYGDKSKTDGYIRVFENKEREVA